MVFYSVLFNIRSQHQFATVFDAVLSGVSLLFKSCSSASVTGVHFVDVSVLQRGRVCLNPVVCLSYTVSVSHRVAFWSDNEIQFVWIKVWTFPQKSLLLNKVKDASFKIIQQCQPTFSFRIYSPAYLTVLLLFIVVILSSLLLVFLFWEI